MSRMRELLYQGLESPLVYQLSQRILGPGAEKNITARIQVLLDQLPASAAHLDIGCGPSSWLFRNGVLPVGVDINPDYINTYQASGAEGHVASATNLPFADNQFDVVWSIGLLHHLPNAMVADTVREAIRVCKPEGRIFIFDAVKPESWMSRPAAAALRRLDRGEHMRSQSALVSLLGPLMSWRYERFTYAYSGLEMLLCASQGALSGCLGLSATVRHHGFQAARSAE